MFGKSCVFRGNGRIRGNGRGAVLFGLFAMLLAWCGLGAIQPAHAAITWSGDLDPLDPENNWNSETDGYVGYFSPGTLGISAGDTLGSHDGYIANYATATGEVTVEGTGSSWACGNKLFVGHSGNGTLGISDGGEVSNVDYGFIAVQAGSISEVTVDGTNSTWNSGSRLHVGGYGSGKLTITGGGTVNSTEGTIAFRPGSAGEVTVDGDDSTWTNTSTLYVGDQDGGTLMIRGGGAVSNVRGIIGNEADATGTVTVDGDGSTWTSSERLYVGQYGNGTLEITNGGAVTNEAWGIVGVKTDSTGEVTVDGEGSSWTNVSNLYVGNAGNGALNITGGGLVSVGGLLTIANTATSTGAINMSTEGKLALLGDADDSLEDFLGLVAGTGEIRWWNDTLGDWAPLASATPGVNYTLNYLAGGDLEGYTLLTVGAGSGLLAGDLNGDGFVGGDDLDIVRSFWGQEVDQGALLQGDPSNDGFVGGDDLDIVRANWGQGSPPAPTSVPEPSAAALLAAGLVALGVMRRRR